MNVFGNKSLGALFAAGIVSTLTVALWAQQPAQPSAPAPQPVTIKREALSLNDPAKYNIPLKTVPAKSVEITAPMEGYVRQVQSATGDKVSAQAEAFRMDDLRPRMFLERAQANLRAAKVEVKIAEAKRDEDQQALAKAHVEAAQAELKIAENDLEHSVVKFPFDGEVLRVQVVPGQYVRPGEPLMTLADTSTLLANVPGDRTKHKAGSEMEVMVEHTAVKGKVQALLPPDERFEPLRPLIPGLTSVLVKIDNPRGEFFAGQTVFVKMIPRQPFTQVPTVAISNLPDGRRQVQVMREGVIRDLPLVVLTQVGTEKVYVAAAFSEGDELIVNSSQPLKDGQQVRLQSASSPATPGKGAATATKPAEGL